MGRAATDDGLPTISICPRCGARLVTRNLWHTCGTYTLEGLFPTSEPAVLDLARKYVAMLYTLGDRECRATCGASGADEPPSSSCGFVRGFTHQAHPQDGCLARREL
jgi:hypothetical protein